MRAVLLRLKLKLIRSGNSFVLKLFPLFLYRFRITIKSCGREICYSTSEQEAFQASTLSYFLFLILFFLTTYYLLFFVTTRSLPLHHPVCFKREITP